MSICPCLRETNLDGLHVMQCLSAGLEPLVLGLHDGGVVAGHGAAHQELAGDGEEGAQHAARHGRHAQVAVHQTCTNSRLLASTEDMQPTYDGTYFQR